MTFNKKLAQRLAWAQMVFSALFAIAIVWGYVSFRLTFGQFIESLSESVSSVSKVVAMTAERIKTGEQVLESTKQTIVATRAAISDVQNFMVTQSKQAPQRAEEIRAASAWVSRFGGALSSAAEGLDFSIPSKVTRDGLKLELVWSKPLESKAVQWRTAADELKTISGGMSNLAKTIEEDGGKMGASFGQLSDKTLKLLDAAETSLSGIQNQDLPKAIQEMNNAAVQLDMISKSVAAGSGIGIALLVIGLLTSGWFFLNSFGQLVLARKFSEER